MRDLARSLNVSQSTVSRALRNDPRISKSVGENIRAAAARLGYRPDPMLSALADYRHGRVRCPIRASLAWINHWPESARLRYSHECDGYWRGAREEANHHGFRLEEFILGPALPAARLQKILLTRDVRGILIPPCHEGHTPDWGRFSWDQFCAIRLGHSVETPAAHLVTADQTNNALIAYERAWQLGYRRIALVCRHITRSSAGYFLAASRFRAGNQMLAPLFLDGDRKQCLPELKRWMIACRPDAVITDVPDLSRWLAELGFSVPEDIALASLSVGESSVEAGINEETYEIGRAAAQTLIALMKNNDYGIPELLRTVLLQGKWVEGMTLPKAAAFRRPHAMALPRPLGIAPLSVKPAALAHAA